MTEQILSKLIEIPSYVSEENDERKALDYIYNLLNQNFPQELISKQYISKNSKRYNILFGNINSPKVIFAGHIDTVFACSGWKTDPFKLTYINGKYYGLGVNDMKG